VIGPQRDLTPAARSRRALFLTVTIKGTPMDLSPRR